MSAGRGYCRQGHCKAITALAVDAARGKFYGGSFDGACLRVESGAWQDNWKREWVGAVRTAGRVSCFDIATGTSRLYGNALPSGVLSLAVAYVIRAPWMLALHGGEEGSC